jgi:hypothetical protein
VSLGTGAGSSHRWLKLSIRTGSQDTVRLANGKTVRSSGVVELEYFVRWSSSVCSVSCCPGVDMPHCFGHAMVVRK